MDAIGHLNGYRVDVIGQRFPNEWMWLAHSTENISLTAVVGYTYWSVSQSHPVHWESSTNHIHSISINQTSRCDRPICELTTTKLPRSLAYFNILNRNVGYWKSDQKSYWNTGGPSSRLEKKPTMNSWTRVLSYGRNRWKIEHVIRNSMGNEIWSIFYDKYFEIWIFYT